MSQDRQELVAQLSGRARAHERHMAELIENAIRFDEYAVKARHDAQATYYANRADNYRRQAEVVAIEAKVLRDAIAALSSTPPVDAVRVLEELRDFVSMGLPHYLVPATATTQQREIEAVPYFELRDAISARLAELRSSSVEAAPATAPDAPPLGVVEIALGQAGYSTCRSKRGAVVFTESQGGIHIQGRGHNRRPGCDGSDRCKQTCRFEAEHAETAALLLAGKFAKGADLVHVKAVDGALVASGPPSCARCSMAALQAGIVGVWLYHADGWRRYLITQFHQLSLEGDPHA